MDDYLFLFSIIQKLFKIKKNVYEQIYVFLSVESIGGIKIAGCLYKKMISVWFYYLIRLFLKKLEKRLGI